MSKELLEIQVMNRILVNQQVIMNTLSMSCELQHQRGSLQEAIDRTDKIIENIGDDEPQENK